MFLGWCGGNWVYSCQYCNKRIPDRICKGDGAKLISNHLFSTLYSLQRQNKYNTKLTLKMPKPQRDPHAPKRAQSSYLLYQNAHREQFKAEVSFVGCAALFVFDAYHVFNNNISCYFPPHDVSISFASLLES